MKKLIALLLALIMCLSTGFAEQKETENTENNEAGEAVRTEEEGEEEAAPELTDEEKGHIAMLTQVGTEEEMYVYKYINRNTGYTLSIPIHWAIIGTGSTRETLSNAREILEDSEYDADAIYRQLSADNDVLVCISKDGRGLVLTYGTSTPYAGDGYLIDHLSDIEAQLSKELPGVKFEAADCGSYNFRSVASILRIHMTLNDVKIDQYYLNSGTTLYIFSFYNATEYEKNAVLTNFYDEIVEAKE